VILDRVPTVKREAESGSEEKSQVGIAGRVRETYPSLTVQGFAAMRAIFDSKEFRSLMGPCKGVITLSGKQNKRRP